ncbi:MAG: hypothetical protein U5L96_20475 [Owenweeksia sp.]|nr:hypothetical protein [Owenweeksia sp.]
MIFLIASGRLQAQKTDSIYTSQGKLYQIITTKGNTKRVQTFSYSGSLESDAHFKNGKKHGVQKEYTTYGNLKIEAHYEDGLRSGTFKEYWPKGEIWQEINYKIFWIDGQKQSLAHGEAKYYHQNGDLSREGNYNQGKEDGLWKSYDNHGGKLLEEKVYKDGKMAGMHITYYPNGQIESKAEVYEDVTVDNVYFQKLIKGWNKRYFDNGKPEHFTEIENGKPTGNEKRWYKEGGLRYEAELTDENHRVSKYYSEKGELGLYIEEKKTLKDGYVRWVKHGEERNYTDGNLTAVRHYANGERHGKFEQYGEEGQLLSSGRSYKDKLVGTYKNYYENGQLKEIRQKDFVIYWRGDTGLVDNGWQKRYTESGQLTFEALKDMGDDVYQATYSEQGNLLSRTYQIHNLKWTQDYYPKGKLKSDQINNFYHSQKGVWFINGVQQEVLIKSHYKYEDTYEIKRDGRGAILAAKKNGKAFTPDSAEVHSMLFSQSSSFYQNQLFNGAITLNYNSGQKRLCFNLKDSLPDGAVRLYRPDGSLAFYGDVQAGLSRGVSYFLSSKGDTMMWQRKGFNKEVERKSWSTDSSFTESKYNERGVRLYTYETYPGGAPKLLVDEENNIHKRWQPDGTLSSESHPAEGFENRTVHIDYYPNGQLRSKQYLENKQRTGVYEYYYENGQLHTSQLL